MREAYDVTQGEREAAGVTQQEREREREGEGPIECTQMNGCSDAAMRIIRDINHLRVYGNLYPYEDVTPPDIRSQRKGYENTFCSQLVHVLVVVGIIVGQIADVCHPPARSGRCVT